MGTPKDLADRLEHPWQEGPFRWKDLVGMTELVYKTFFFPGIY